MAVNLSPKQMEDLGALGGAAGHAMATTLAVRRAKPPLPPLETPLAPRLTALGRCHADAACDDYGKVAGNAAGLPAGDAASATAGAAGAALLSLPFLKTRTA